ncbi:hypothetical protein DL98DRAFT_315242 [Cadophora sp. DSE1049]|nr:hypothetical protein DL98DRAFT_315242 [Cadophora sp. DSE1049]
MPPHLAQELKDIIMRHLPLRSTRSFALSFRSKFPPEEICKRTWSELFKEDNKWIANLLKHGFRPILVGHDLNDVDRDSHKPLYITLITDDWFDDCYEPELLLDSLKSQDFDNNKYEVTFKDSNIILNINGPYRSGETISVNPRNIIAKESVSTTSLTWGNHNLHQISHKDVVSIGTVNKNNFESVDTICAIKVVRSEGKRWNQIFENPVQQSGFRKKKKDPKNPRLHQGWEGYADKRHRLI